MNIKHRCARGSKHGIASRFRSGMWRHHMGLPLVHHAGRNCFNPVNAGHVPFRWLIPWCELCRTQRVLQLVRHRLGPAAAQATVDAMLASAATATSPSGLATSDASCRIAAMGRVSGRD
jgi:hypothetical protein